MCGLAGIITKKPNGLSREQVDAFHTLLYIDALRGKDSTGAFLVEKDGTMELIKEATEASYFQQHQDYKDLLNKSFQRGSALIGHNRAATKGTITDANAHPFVVGDQITLMHNGTLWGNHKDLADVDVDSHAIAHVIHENGDDVEKALQKINGAFALIWHDFKNGTLNFIRNKHRPLYWIELEDGWVWSSEQAMIQFVVNRHGLKPMGKINDLPEGTLTTFKQGKGTWEVNSKRITLEAPKSHTPPIYTPPTGMRRHPYANGYWPDSNLDDEYDEWGEPLAKPSDAVVPVVVAHPIFPGNKGLVLHPPTGNLHRIDNEEQKIAAKNKIDVPAITFMNEQAETSKEDVYISATCVDFIEASTGNKQMGYYLYGKIDGNSKTLIKQWMPASTEDTFLLDLVLNNKRCLFNIRGRSWVGYKDAANGCGFGMLNAKGVKPIESIKEIIEVK